MEHEFQFWVVWNPQQTGPTVRHSSAQVAKAEAERLAAAQPGDRFYVLKALRYSQMAQRVTVELQPPAPAIASAPEYFG